MKGKVVDFTLAGGIVESITVQDDSGESCRVFIDGYIGYSDEMSQALEEFVQDGAYISAVGFVSHDAEGNRLRVRDRSEILPAEEEQQPAPGGGENQPDGSERPDGEDPAGNNGQPDDSVQDVNDSQNTDPQNNAQNNQSADSGKAAQTGDTTPVGLWIAAAVMAAMAAGASAVVTVRKKRK